MIFHHLSSFVEQVLDHATGFGTIWYVLTFGYRLYLATGFESVYYDEDGMSCQEVEHDSCHMACFNQFIRLSHVRFWILQLVAVAVPTVLFHLYASKVGRDIGKIEDAETLMKSIKDGDINVNVLSEEQIKKLSKLKKRKKAVGKYKTRTVYRGNNVNSVPYTKKLMIGYVLNLVCRFALELGFVFISVYMYNFKDGERVYSLGNWLWMEVPGIFKCDGMIDEAVDESCHKHTGTLNEITRQSKIHCSIPRSTEKTLLLRSVHFVTFACLICTIFELLLLCYRHWSHSKEANKNKKSLSLTSIKSESGSQLHEMIELKDLYSKMARSYV